MTNLSRRLRSAFSIDLRSLALFRVLAGLAVIINVLILLSDVGAWFADDGLISREDAIARLTPYHFSVYYVSGATWYSCLLLVATLIAASAMLIGWRTRIATCVTWALMVSLTNRIPILLSGADVQLTVLLFWGMFLPLGARFSIDAALSTEKRNQPQYFSVATVALLLQVTYLYFFGALLKEGAPWRETYDAVYFAISSLEITTPLAVYLANFPSVLPTLTVYVFYLELVAALFLFSPYFQVPARLLVLAQLVAMHIGFALFLSIAIFPLVSIAGLTTFLPSAFWEKGLSLWNRRGSRRDIVLYYDRDCGFCRKVCYIFREFCLPPDTAIRPAQDDDTVASILERENSWVVRTHDGHLLTKWPAVAYVWRRSPLLWGCGVFFLLPIARQFGNFLYSRIVAYRALLGSVTTRLLPYRDGTVFYPRRPTQFVLSFLAALVFLWNVDTVRDSRVNFYFPDSLRPLMWSTRLTQHWNMFAPNPMNVNRWIVVEGRDHEGLSVDLLFGRDRQPSHERPANGFETFPNYRWRKFFGRVDIANEGRRVADFHCKRSKGHGFGTLETVELSYYVQAVAPPGHPSEPVESRFNYLHHCRPGALQLKQTHFADTE